MQNLKAYYEITCSYNNDYFGSCRDAFTTRAGSFPPPLLNLYLPP